MDTVVIVHSENIMLIQVLQKNNDNINENINFDDFNNFDNFEKK